MSEDQKGARIRDLVGSFWPEKPRGDWRSGVEAIRAGAAYIAQGASYSYLRARTLLAGPRLFQDEGFGMALEICKWEGFGVAAQDLILILDSDLRDRLPADPAARHRGLAALYGDVLAAEAVPGHRAATGWDDLRAEFDARLLMVLPLAPRRPDAIAAATAERLLRHAPIDDSVREADREMVTNNTAFRFIEYQDKLRRRLDLPAFAALLAQRMAEPG